VTFEIDHPIIASQPTHQLSDADVDRVDATRPSSKQGRYESAGTRTKVGRNAPGDWDVELIQRTRKLDIAT
jgi:hypothetical protein